MTEVAIDENGVGLVINTSMVDGPDVVDALEAAGQRKIAAAMGSWIQKVAPPTRLRRRGRFGGILERDKFLAPLYYFDKVRVAREALKDDVIGGAADGTEALALEHVTIECDDEHQCVDEETEILTLRGWTHHKDLEDGDPILTLNPETGCAEWLPTEWIVRKPAPDTLISLTGRNFDALVTPNHRWLVSSYRPGSALRFVTTTELNTYHRIPFARPTGPSPLEGGWDDAFVALAGWFVTEGSWGRSRTGSLASTRCVIPQSETVNPEKCREIERLLTQVGVRCLPYMRDTGIKVFEFSGPVARRLRQCFPDKALTIDFVNSLSPRQRSLLVGSLVGGDGNRKGSTWTFTTTSPEQAEAFSHLCLLDGFVTTTATKEPGQTTVIRGKEVTSRKLQYVVHVLATKQAKVESLTRVDVPGSGVTVWCPHTRNGSFLARRNGAIYFTGNSDIWNQIAADIDLDGQLRKHWRSLFTDSAAVMALWWGRHSYKSRLPTAAGQEARKVYDLQIPTGVTFFDTTKIVPVGPLEFDQEFLAYQAEPLEALMFDQILAQRDGYVLPLQRPQAPRVFAPGRLSRSPGGVAPLPIDPRALALERDPLVERMVIDRYIPSIAEAERLCDDGIDELDNLYLLDPKAVFRHTATRLDYMRFPEVRGESWFELLDLKTQLRQMDRVHLVGGAHMIILITKGTDQKPAEQPEIDALQANAQTIASVPLIVGDHRLNVQIITPKLDVTLDQQKWDTLDVRLFARAWGSFIPTGDDLSDPTKIGRVIGRSLESRRKMMRRVWEKNVFLQIMERNEDLTERPKLVFQPAQIAIAFDAAWASFVLDLREIGDIAHSTSLAQFGFNIADEYRKVQREKAQKEAFMESAPHNPHGPQAGGDGAGGGGRQARRAGGRRGGGEKGGGGAAEGSGQGKEATGRSRSGGGRRARTQDSEDEP